MLKNNKFKAFLLLELLISLALLVSLISVIGYWQLRILQQTLEVQQYTQALNLAENSIERFLALTDTEAGRDEFLQLSRKWQTSVSSSVSSLASTIYNLELQLKEQFELAKTKFCFMQITVGWQSKFSQQQRSLILDTGLLIKATNSELLI